MDNDLWRWVLELILRQLVYDDLLIEAISAMDTRRNDPRLLRTSLLLQSLQCAAKASDSIFETVLENLEIVEEMNRRVGTEIPDSMKVAYCAVAVCCIVKHVGGGEGADDEYFHAVRRIWKAKVEKLKCKSELFSEELRNWGDAINGALFDEVKWRGLVEKKRRVGEVILVAVNRYLEEAWAIMGPPFLKSVAKELVAMEDSRGGSGQLVNLSQELVENSDSGVELAAEIVHGLGDQQAAESLKQKEVWGLCLVDKLAGENVGEMLKFIRSEYDASRSGLETRTSVTVHLHDTLPTPK